MKSNVCHSLAIVVTTLLFAAAIARGADVNTESVLGAKITEAFEAGDLQGLHSVLIIQDGETLAETHFPGHDERWGSSIGQREHGPGTLHDLRSVTKPIVGLLYGIALAEGKVPGLDEKLFDQFPEYPDLAEDEARNGTLIRHVLSMKMGIAWNEDLPYTDPKNSEIAMEYAEDRYRYVLEQPMVDEPGGYWVYNGGAVALVGKLITEGVGMPIDKYAEQALFNPLGITDFEWVHGGDNVPSVASGLRLNIHDLAKIGVLINNNGEYNDNQIIPSQWLKDSFAPTSELESGLRYGLLWWLAPWGEPPAWMAGFGNGGQRLTINPEHNLIVAVYAGNYNQPDGWKLPEKIIEEFIVPALKAKAGK